MVSDDVKSKLEEIKRLSAELKEAEKNIKIEQKPKKKNNKKLDVMVRIDSNEATRQKDIVRYLQNRFGEENVSIEKLEVADYIIGQVGFERKADDITNIEHLLQQVNELVENFKIPIVIIEKSFEEIDLEFRYRTQKRGMASGIIASIVARGAIPIMAGNKDNLKEIMYKIGMKANDGKNRAILPTRPVISKKDYAVRVMMGYPKIGEKKAIDLLNTFGTIEMIEMYAEKWVKMDKKTKKATGLTRFNSALTTIYNIRNDSLESEDKEQIVVEEVE